MADATYQPKVFRKQGGDELVVAAGGKLTQEGGGAVVRPVRIVTANVSLTAAESGLILICDAADLVITLPATVAGLIFTVVCAAVSAGTGLSLSPAAADKINEGTANKDLINSGATDVLGDSVTLVSDGVTGWYTINKIGTWAAEG